MERAGSSIKINEHFLLRDSTYFEGKIILVADDESSELDKLQAPLSNFSIELDFEEREEEFKEGEIIYFF